MADARDANDNNTTGAGVVSSNGDTTLARSTLNEASSASDVEDDVNVVGQAIDFEVVGLFSSTNGRSCCCHKTCGREVRVGDLLRLVRTVVDIGENTETAIKLVKIVDGCDGCTIGFIPRVQSR